MYSLILYTLVAYYVTRVDLHVRFTVWHDCVSRCVVIYHVCNIMNSTADAHRFCLLLTVKQCCGHPPPPPSDDDNVVDTTPPPLPPMMTMLWTPPPPPRIMTMLWTPPPPDDDIIVDTPLPTDDINREVIHKHSYPCLCLLSTQLLSCSTLYACILLLALLSVCLQYQACIHRSPSL